MKKQLLFGGLLITYFLSSCSRSADFYGTIQEENYNQVANVQNSTEITLKNYVEKIKLKKLNTRSSSSYSMSPVVSNGDTIMYAVNYNQGWELLSCDERTPLVLVSSESGSFEGDDSFSAPSALAFYNILKENLIQLRTQQFERTNKDDLWQALTLDDSEVDSELIEVSPKAIGAQPGNGYWVPIEIYESEPTVSTINHIIQTKWGQDYPWNIYSPVDRGTVCPAGCGPVALGQYLYFSHYKDNLPSQTYSTAIYNPSTNDYTFSGYSSSVWNSMATDDSQVGTNYVALLLRWIGQSTNVVYKTDKSSIDKDEALNFLNDLGFNFTLEDAMSNLSYIDNKLRNGYPTITTANCANHCDSGHMFIIDGMEQTTQNVTTIFGWVGTDNRGHDSNEYDDEGNVVGYEFTYTRNTTTNSYKYLMNWGWDGYCDNLKLAFGNWNSGGHQFNSNVQIFK